MTTRSSDTVDRLPGQQLPKWFETDHWVSPSEATWNVTDLMRTHSIPSFDALSQRAASDADWFYRAAFDHLHLDWMEGFDKVIEEGDPSMAQWFAGGRTNLGWLAVDRWAVETPDSPAIVSVEEDGTTEMVS